MKITLPFNESQLLKLFETKDCDQTYIIDGKTSLANLGDKLCLYVSNLNLKCDIDCSDLTYDQKAELIDQYLNTIKICDIPSLTETLLTALLVHSNAPSSEVALEKSIMTHDEIVAFTQSHKEVMDRLMVCLYSFVALILQYCKKTGQVECDVEFEQINDRYYMPVNLVNVLKYHDLLPCYHQLTLDKVKYLKYQFESPIFNNKYLGDYVFDSSNLLAVFIINLLQITK